jgi:hypothetical protein
MTMQVLRTTDSECVHLSPAYCASAQDKPVFDDLQVIRFLATNIPGAKWFLTDLGGVEIRRTIERTDRCDCSSRGARGLDLADAPLGQRDESSGERYFFLEARRLRGRLMIP